MTHFKHLTLEQADWLTHWIKKYGLEGARANALLRFGLDDGQFRGFVQRNQRTVASALNTRWRA